MIFRQLFEKESFTYTYIIADDQTKEAAIIDSVAETKSRDLQLIEEMGLNLKFIIETHIHADHITAASFLKEKTSAEIVLGKGTGLEKADRCLDDGDKLFLGPLEIKALATPGHTEGCTSFLAEGRLFTGDALLIRGCGRTDFQGGSSAQLFDSVRSKIFSLPDETLIYPGHDYQGRTCSSVGEEKQHNIRLRLTNDKEKFIRIMSNLNLDPPKKINIAVPANLKLGAAH